MRHVCQARGLDNVSDSDRVSQSSQYLVDDRHRVIYKGFAKSGSTSWISTLIGAMGGIPKKGKARSESFLNTVGLRRLSRKYYKPEEILFRLKNYFKFLVVRHPYDRILSTWRDKFVILYKAESGKPLPLKIFLGYIRRYDNSHWEPYQSAHPCVVQWDAIVKVETMLRDSPPILRKLGLNYTKLPIIHSHRDNKSDIYRLRKTLEEFRSVPPRHLNFLRTAYAVDMEMFGYTWNSTTMEAVCGNGGDMCC